MYLMPEGCESNWSDPQPLPQAARAGMWKATRRIVNHSRRHFTDARLQLRRLCSYRASLLAQLLHYCETRPSNDLDRSTHLYGDGKRHSSTQRLLPPPDPRRLTIPRPRPKSECENVRGWSVYDPDQNIYLTLCHQAICVRTKRTSIRIPRSLNPEPI